MPGEFDVTGARAAGYSDEEIAEYLRSKKLTPRATLAAPTARMSPADAEAAFQATRKGILDLRPTPAHPLVGGPPLDTSPEAGEALLRYGVMPGLALGGGALGGPATMTLRQMFMPAAQALLGPLANPDPNVMQGTVSPRGPRQTGILRMSGIDLPRVELAAEDVLGAASRSKGGYKQWSTRNPTIEEGMFDFAGAKPAIEGRPMLERYDPPRGAPSRLTDALNNPKVTRRLRTAVREGNSMMPERWYNTGPILDEFKSMLGEEEGPKAFQRFLEYVAATSPRNPVPDNIRTASLYYYKDRQNLPFSLKPEKGYGSIAQKNHLKNALTIREQGGLDPMTNPKPASFVENLLGNQQPVTIDTHNFRLIGMAAEDPRFLMTKVEAGKDPVTKAKIYRNPQKEFAEGKLTMKDALADPNLWESAPRGTEYKAYEDWQHAQAKSLGMTPAEWQENMWVGGGYKTPFAPKGTGLESPPETFLRTFARRVQYTAQKLGADPQVVLRKFIRGEIPLLGIGGAAAVGLQEQRSEPTQRPAMQ